MDKRTLLFIVLSILLATSVAADIDFGYSVSGQTTPPPSPSPPPSSGGSTTSSGGGGGGYGIPRFNCRNINITAYNNYNECIQYNNTCEIPRPVQYLQRCKLTTTKRIIQIDLSQPQNQSSPPAPQTIVQQSSPPTGPPVPPPPESQPSPPPDTAPVQPQPSHIDPIAVLLFILIGLLLIFIAYKRFQKKTSEEQHA